VRRIVSLRHFRPYLNTWFLRDFGQNVVLAIGVLKGDLQGDGPGFLPIYGENSEKFEKQSLQNQSVW